MKTTRPFIVLALFLALLSLSSLAMAVKPTQNQDLAYDLIATPPPTATPTPPGGGGSVVTSITQIFHH